jgi:protein gp37
MKGLSIMGEYTNIGWCDSTTNPTTGCDGCELWGPTIHACYAGTLHETRLAKSLPKLYAPDFQEIKLAPGRIMQAAKWRDLTGTARPDKPWLNGLPRLIFIGDMGDMLSRDVPTDYLTDEVLSAITSPQGLRHIWMILTKQPARLAELSIRIGGLPANVIAMTTVTTQSTVKPRINELLKTKCHWRGISVEPLLGPVDLSPYLDSSKIHLTILGGESAQPGHIPRRMAPEWAISIINQCRVAGVPVFFKQLGDVLAGELGLKGKGEDFDKLPPEFRIRQLPPF